MPPDNFLPHPEDLRALFFVCAELVHAYYYALSVIHRHLVAVRGLLYLPLLVAHLDRAEGAAHVVDAVEVAVRLFLDAVCQLLQVVGAGERVNHIGNAGLVADYLLGPEGDLHRLLGRQRQRLVHGVGVQGLGAAEDGGERLDGGAHDVVLRLLRGESGPTRLRMEAQHH